MSLGAMADRRRENTSTSLIPRPRHSLPPSHRLKTRWNDRWKVCSGNAASLKKDTASSYRYTPSIPLYDSFASSIPISITTKTAHILDLCIVVLLSIYHSHTSSSPPVTRVILVGVVVLWRNTEIKVRTRRHLPVRSSLDKE